MDAKNYLGQHGMAQAPNELLHGTLGTLILKPVARGPIHGDAIARGLEDATGDVLRIEDGSLYPALYRMSSAAGSKPSGARRTAEWARFAGAVSKVLLPA